MFIRNRGFTYLFNPHFHHKVRIVCETLDHHSHLIALLVSDTLTQLHPSVVLYGCVRKVKCLVPTHGFIVVLKTHLI
jgi:hypothetical protein